MKKLVLFIALVLTLMFAFTSCKIGGGNSGGGNTGGSTDGGSGDTGGGSNDGDGDSTDTPEGVLIFDKNTKVAIISNKVSDEYPENRQRMIDLMNIIARRSGQYAGIYTESQETRGENEIVIGDSNRAITAKAYELLESRLKREIRSAEDEDFAEQDLVGYAVYASGGDVAIVWSDFRMEEIAYNFFVDNYIINSSLYLKEDYLKTEVLSISEFLQERESKIIAEAWETLEAQLPAQYARGIIDAYKRLYALYDQSMIVWYANLGDPETGGFYHSNSARDNHGFLPDIENTLVVTNFIEVTGMAEMRDNDWTNVIPDWWQKRMGDWILSMEDEDTFFYHPQWPKEFIIAGDRQSRITRDRGSAKTLLRKLGRYDEMMQAQPAATSSKVWLTGRVNAVSPAVAASKVVATAGGMLSQYESVDNFRIYLADLERQVLAAETDDSYAYQFYWMGNQFQSTVNYINADKTGEMKRLLIEFFEKYQNPETGLWDRELCYNSTNALHKVGSVYNSLGVEMKHTDKMLASVLEILGWNMDTPAHTANAGVDIYNAWSCFSYIYNNLRNYASGTKEENYAKVEDYKMRVFAALGTLIDKTFNQIAGFRRDDGSYGYSRTGSSHTAQGCPAALSGVHEGDANGNAIASYDIIYYIIAAVELEEYMVPMFTEEDCNVFVNIIENLGTVIKNERQVDEELFFDFSDVEIGKYPDDITVTLDSNRVQNPGSHVYVVEGEGHNNVLEYVGMPREVENGRNLALGFTIPNVSPNPNVVVLDMDIKFFKAGCDVNSQLIQYNVQGAGSPVIYPTFRLNNKGEIWFYNSNGEALTVLGKADEWIDFRLEYYWDEGVYKIYVDGVCRASGTETYNSRAHQEASSVMLSTPSGTHSHFQLDNVNYSKQNRKYIDASREVLEEKVYTFNTVKLPSEITVNGADDSYSLESMGEGEGYALKTKSALFTVPSYLRTYFGNADIFEFDIAVPDAGTVGTDTVVSTVNLNNVKGTALWKLDIGIDANGKLYFAKNDSFAERVNVGTSITEFTTVKLISFTCAGTGKCDNVLFVYVGGSDTAACYTLTMAGKPEAEYEIKSATFGSLNGTVDVLYDNVRLERNSEKYEPPVSYPTVTPGEDTPTLGFEDYNVGEVLPDRITGDATVGIELDGSNRFLQITDGGTGKTNEVVIDLFETSSQANNSIIEFDFEVLSAISAADLVTFSLVDSKGITEDLFKIGNVSYSATLALRPTTMLDYTALEKNNSLHLWKWAHNYSQLDGSPNIVTREYLLNGMTANAPAASKTDISIEVDWTNQLVYVYYNRNVNKFHKDNGGPAVYKTSLKNIQSLKITTGNGAAGVITLDNIRAENIYVTPPTANQTPNHAFNGNAGTPINGYISNGTSVKPGSGSVQYGGAGDTYLDVQGGAIGSNPVINVPVFTESGVTANKSVIKLDVEADKLFSSDSLQIQLMNGNEAVTGITLREVDGKVKMYHCDAKFTSTVRYVYAASSFVGGEIPLVTTETYNALSAEDRAGLSTRVTIVIEYAYATGLITVSLENFDTTAKPVYSALAAPVSGISSVNLMIPSANTSDVNIYNVYAENLYDAGLGSVVSFQPTIKDVEGEYEEVEVEWECTHSGHTGETLQHATNIYFEDGLAVEFNAESGYANTHEAQAYIVTEQNGNRYVEVNVPHRISSRDRAYSIKLNVEKCSTEANVYIFGGSFYFDSASTHKGFLQLAFYNGTKKYAQLQMDTSSSVISVQGVKIGSWDSWIDVRFEYYPEEKIMQVYVGDAFKGNITNVYASSSSANKTVSEIGDSVSHISLSGVNSTSSGYIMRMDNLYCYSTSKSYVEGVFTAVPEDFESKVTVDESGVGDNLYFDSGFSLLYGGAANAAGSYAEVLEELGNKFVHIVAKKRVDTKDRGYNVLASLQNVTPNSNAYVYEARLRFDSWSTTGMIAQILIRQDKNNYGQYNLDNTMEYVGFGGVKIANWDEWFNLKLVHFPTEGVIYVYAKADGAEDYEYRGSLGDFDTSNAAVGNKIANLPSLESINIALYNSNGDAILDIDDVMLYNTKLVYEDMSGATVSELPEPNLKDPRPEYKVNFDVDGTVVESETVNTSTPTVAAPTAPSKEGYIFDGWYVDKDTWEIPYTADYFVSNPISGDVTVYAKYKEVAKYNVTFLVDGEEYYTESVYANAVITLPTDPKKDGYSFDGWYLDEELTVKFDANAYVNNPLTADITVYAKLTEYLPPEITPDENEPVYGDEIPGADEIVAPGGGDIGDWFDT